MTHPPFFIQLVDGSGTIVRTRTGGKHEAEFINLCLSYIVPKGIGVLRTKSQVEKAIKDGLTEALFSLKVKNPADLVE